MATLAGQKIKDKYGNLLHVEGGLTSTLKVVEDGGGNDSSLKLSTSGVEIDGTLSFTTAPTTSSSELTGLFIDSENNVVIRDLDASAFTADSGGSSTLTDLTDTTITSLASGDLLYYNGTAWINDNTPRTVAFVDNSNAVNFATPNAAGNILFEAGNNMTISYDSNTVSFAAASATASIEETFIGKNTSAHNLPNVNDSDIVVFSGPTNNIDSTSFHFGNTPAKLDLDLTNGEYIENISGESFPVFIDMSAVTEVTSNNSNITYTLQKWNGTAWNNVAAYTRTKSTPGTFIDSFWGIYMLGADERFRIQVSTTTGNIALSAQSQFKFTVKETGNILE